MYKNDPFTLFSTALKKECIEAGGDISNSQIAACIRHLDLVIYKNCQFFVKSSDNIFTSIHAELVLDQIVTKTIPNILRKVIQYYDDEIEPLNKKMEGSKFSEHHTIKSELSNLKSARTLTKRTIKNLGHPEKINNIIERCKVELLTDLPNIDDLIKSERKKEPETITINLDDVETIGVANGILQLTPEIRLHPIIPKHHTTAAYKLYTASDPDIKELETILKTIFSCDDDYNYWMKILASCLLEKPNKKAIIWTSSGNCGVSTIMQLHKEALGFVNSYGYTYVLPQMYITDQTTLPESIHKFNINKARAIVIQESDLDTPMKFDTIHNLLHFGNEHQSSKPENKVKNNANVFITTNNIRLDNYAPYYFNWDDLIVYNFRTTFMQEQDLKVENPNHVLRNSAIVTYYKQKKYLSAYLSILTNFITTDTLCQSRNVYNDTIEFRSKHDPFSKFVSENLCLVGQEFPNGDKVDPIPLQDLRQRFLYSSYKPGAVSHSIVSTHPSLKKWSKHDMLMGHIWKD